MHTMWKGSISFGLVHIPIKLYAATESKDVSFRTLHDVCHTPIRYQKYCPECDTVVENDHLIKGYEVYPGEFVTITDQELQGLKGDVIRAVDILDFVDLSEIDPVYFNRSYFVGPNENGGKAYALLRQALKETNKIGLAKLTLHSKEHLAVVRVYKEGLMLETMYYPDEVRPVNQVPGLEQMGEFDEKELTTAKQLIEQLTTAFEPEKYKDTYREDVQHLVEEKLAGHETTAPKKAPARENVVDLLAALQKSVEETRGSTPAQPTQAPPKKAVPSARTAEAPSTAESEAPPKKLLAGKMASASTELPKKKTAKTSHKKKIGL
ncbi:Ku protein [Pullulanibacillus sp. KACC 23026]|uniref:non-homologous end joining protein Ku n=1 Tax=Pullulanibacillus sp. KACC 23026 TaxID=3028315 RepID=UPI0023B0D292|nr:Ku protein [Pullulanibacillus sp. KACC 23026]WEG11950.1 Ku protein [Pullulanibacillus sp. KACC 23026]